MIKDYFPVFQNLGLSDEEITKFIQSYRNLQKLTPEELQKNINYLRSMKILNFNNIIKSRPQILFYSLDKLKNQFEFFKKIGISPEKISKIIERDLPLLISTPDDMQKRIKFFKKLKQCKFALIIVGRTSFSAPQRG